MRLRRSAGWFGILFVAMLAVSRPAAAQFGLGLLAPAAPEVSVEQLKGWLADPKTMEKTVLVDVRTEAETSVSVIPGAITKAEYESKMNADYRGKKVVVYCTVGGRSGAYAKQLAAKGVDVVNFKGSILAWAGAEQPFETLDRKPTKRVHTYNGRNRVLASYEAVY